MTAGISTNRISADSAGWIPVVLAAMAFLPPEFSLKVGEVLIMPYRIILLVLLVPALLRLVATRSLSVYDAALAGFGLCAFVSMIYNHGTDGLASGGLAALETTGSYIVARAFLGSKGFDTFARTWIAICIALLPVLVLESVLHRNIIHDLAAAMTGGPSQATSVARTERFGLFRVSGPFTHAILCGVAYATFLPVLLFRGNAIGYAPAVLLLVLGVLLSVSTDPLLTRAVGIMAAFALWRASQLRWRSLTRSILIVVVPVFVILQSLSNRGGFAGLATP